MRGMIDARWSVLVLWALCSGPRPANAGEGPGNGEQTGLKTAGVRLLKRFAAVPEHGIQFATVVEIDPSLTRVKTVSASRLLGTRQASVLRMAQALPESLAAINASFFPPPPRDKQKEDILFDGLFVEDGEVRPHRMKQRRVFFVTKEGRAGIAPFSQVDPTRLESAVAGLSSGNETDKTARTAVCITKAGRVLFVAAYPVRTLNAMTRYLLEAEGCEDYVHLDGGGSTQMVYDAGGEALAFGWERDEKCLTAEGPERPPKCYRKVVSALVALPR